MDQSIYDTYIAVLKSELIPAMGCTEPIAIAYAAAIGREVLGCLPEQVEVKVSGNIIKNVKSVIVPGTNHMKGIEAAAAAGIIAGKAQRQLEVIRDVTEEQRTEIEQFVAKKCIMVGIAESELLLDVVIRMKSGDHECRVRIANSHTNLVLVEKDGTVIEQRPLNCLTGNDKTELDKSLLNIRDILEFADTVEIKDIHEVIKRQIDYNMAIAEEGLKGNYGANIGRVLLKQYGENDIRIRAKAKAAAGSDARMSGCELPVVINSGSGNQGITVSVPVIEYARELGSGEEKLYRALALSNLIAIHQKAGIGPLSAYCGAISAGCASAAAIAYLHGGGYYEISHTIVNCLAIASGIVCDGAKPSCAAKISMAIEAGLTGYFMIQEKQQFRDGEGIVKRNVEETIDSVCRLGKDGMRETDKEILRIMLHA